MPIKPNEQGIDRTVWQDRDTGEPFYDESAHGDASRGRKSSARARMWKYSPLSDVADEGEGDGFGEGDSDGV